jgi:amidohydrolase
LGKGGGDRIGDRSLEPRNNPPVTGAEDFSFYQREKPGLFIGLGGMKKGADPTKTPSHHTPDFYLDESGFVLGVRVMSYFVVDFMGMKK